MLISDKFYAINIREYLALGDDPEAGEPALVKLLSGFSCPKNLDVERFLKKSAIELTKKNQSVTYVVISVKDGRYKEITGEELIELAWMVIEEGQYRYGGMVTFLETENEEKLLSFYRVNRFSQFHTRQITSDTDESHELVQLLRML